MRTDETVEYDDAEQNRIQFFAFAIAVIVAVIFSCCLAGWFVNSEQSPRLSSQSGAWAVELENRINPNIASRASLARLPQIGSSRAKTIISYREGISRGDNSRAAFHNCDDLQKVKGIGPKTVMNLCEWLKFE